MTRENYCLKPKSATATATPEPKEPHKQERTKSRPSRSVSSATPTPTPTPTPYSDYTAVDVPNSLFWCLYIGKVGLRLRGYTVQQAHERRDGAEAEGDHVSHRDRHQVEQADKP
jgi:hypothetical protein